MNKKEYHASQKVARKRRYCLRMAYRHKPGSRKWNKWMNAWVNCLKIQRTRVEWLKAD